MGKTLRDLQRVWNMYRGVKIEYVLLSVHFPRNYSRQTTGSVPLLKVLTASDRFKKIAVEEGLSARRVPQDTFSLVLRSLVKPYSRQLELLRLLATLYSLQQELLQQSAVAVAQTSLKYASLNSIDL